MTALELAEMLEMLEQCAKDAAGFDGQFEFQAERTVDRGVGHVADCVRIDDRLVFVEDGADPEDNYDDGIHTIASPIEQHVAEPIARLLNVVLQAPAVAKCLREMAAENERLEEGRRIDAVVAETFRTERDAAIRERDEARDSNAYFERYLTACQERDAAIREADRWRHGQQIEGDYVCPDSLEVTRLTAELAEARAECERMRPPTLNIDGLIVGENYVRAIRIERDAITAELAAARAEIERMRGVYISAGAITAGGRELLPLHLRPLRDAVDAALDAAIPALKDPHAD